MAVHCIPDIIRMCDDMCNPEHGQVNRQANYIDLINSEWHCKTVLTEDGKTPMFFFFHGENFIRNQFTFIIILTIKILISLYSLAHLVS